MPKVAVLPDHIASQIAAGEVVERPSSVVKEFVENSIDAGATQIEVRVSLDCRDLRIADNGCGMDPEDAVLAFQRHATSKIRTADDLWTLNSLGFRGEALPSIASVSKLTCLTRAKEASTGTRVECQDGTITVVETGCAEGTVMEVLDLFYNVPARLNFLKKAATEFGHIQEIVQTLAMAHPDVSFTLCKHDEIVLRSSGSGSLRKAAIEVGHFSGNETLIEIEMHDEQANIKVIGLAAKPLHFRGDRKGILSIVNKRPVRCALTYRALDYAYSDLIPRGKYPLAVLSMTINPATVDVNIHPTKKELKYSNGNETYLVIQRSITRALRAHSLQPASQTENIYHHNESPFASVAETNNLVSTAAYDDSNSGGSVFDRRGAASFMAPRPINRQIDFTRELSTVAVVETDNDTSYESQKLILPQDWRIAGYIHNSYIIIESAIGMEIIEQHIAHERVLYERILATQSVRGRVTDNVQPFLISQPLNLSPEQEAQIHNNARALNDLGFDFKFDADGTVACTQIPQELSGKNYAVVIQTILDEISKADSANFQLEATKSIACQAAIKNGMPLGHSEIINLLTDWINTPRNDTCPHGRPIRMQYSMDKLFQIFHP